jgi:hypothetical protein
MIGKISGLMGQKDESEQLLTISEPSNFRHESSIGWNKDSGFEVTHFPNLWVTFLDSKHSPRMA